MTEAELRTSLDGLGALYREVASMAVQSVEVGSTYSIGTSHTRSDSDTDDDEESTGLGGRLRNFFTRNH